VLKNPVFRKITQVLPSQDSFFPANLWKDTTDLRNVFGHFPLHDSGGKLQASEMCNKNLLRWEENHVQPRKRYNEDVEERLAGGKNLRGWPARLNGTLAKFSMGNKRTSKGEKIRRSKGVPRKRVKK